MSGVDSKRIIKIMADLEQCAGSHCPRKNELFKVLTETVIEQRETDAAIADEHEAPEIAEAIRNQPNVP